MQCFQWVNPDDVISSGDDADRSFSSEVIFALQNVELYDRHDNFFAEDLHVNSILAPASFGGLSRLDDTFEGNLNEWTDKAIQLLKSELQKRGGEVFEDGLKVLSLSVLNAHVETRATGSGTRCRLTLHVETGDGYSTDISVVNNAGIGVERPAVRNGAE